MATIIIDELKTRISSVQIKLMKDHTELKLGADCFKFIEKVNENKK